MRPVNLIPPEERRGERPPLRSGPLPYILLGALLLALVAVTVLVYTGNQIKEREAEVATLEVREAEARARAESLRAFAEFDSVSEARFGTVTSLAKSRFDWERVLRELALVLPDDVWLVGLTGTVSSEAAVPGSAQVALRTEVEGPALSLVGCAAGQDSVAAFVEALKDIDGVTRVGVASSAKPGGEANAGGGESEDDCRTREFIAQFEIVAAFDAVALDEVETPPAPQAPPPAESDGEGPAEQQAGNGSDVVSGVAR